jgi:hypothetical protein
MYRLAGSEPGVARRLHRYLESFSADHPHLPAEEVFELFVGRLIRGLAASTLLTYTTTMRTYGVRPFDTDSVARRIRFRELLIGIRHMAQSAKSEKKNHRRGFTWAHLEALVRRGQQTPAATMSGGLLSGGSRAAPTLPRRAIYG